MTIITCNASEADVHASSYVRVPFWRLMDFALTGAEYLVYSCLLAHQNEANQAFPSYDTMARLVHLGTSTVQRAIRSLEKKGLLQKQTRLVVKDYADGSIQTRYTSNLYTLASVASQHVPPTSTPSAKTQNTRSSVKMTIPSIKMTKELDPVNSLQSTTTSTKIPTEVRSESKFQTSPTVPMPLSTLSQKIVVTPALPEPTHSSNTLVVRRSEAPSYSRDVSSAHETPERVRSSATGATNPVTAKNPSLAKLERVLGACLRRPYHLKPNDVTAFDRLQQQAIPLDWIVENTSNVVEERRHTPIHGFAYIACVLEDWWQARGRTAPTTASAKPAKRKAVPHVKPENDTRYEAFYALFPEERERVASLPEKTTGRDDRYENFYALFPEERTSLL